MIEVDAKEVLGLFADLNSRQQKQVYRNALRRAANILVKETRNQLKSKLGRKANSRNWWHGKTLASGIKSNADKEGKEAKVHIMGDFRLKFFEGGTDIRKTKKGYNRGRMKALNYFERTRNNSSKYIEIIKDEILYEL